MTIHSICVCGAGTMGSGIAQAAAQSGFATIVYDLDGAMIEKSRLQIENSLQQLEKKGKISGADAILKMIRYTTDLHDCLADIFIEAIVEKEEIKIALFNQLAEINHSECIFASNTSSLSIGSIAKGVQHPGRVVGMHFFNPATIMKLVEVVQTPYTTEQVRSTVMDLARSMGKQPVLCMDSPGFIVNRVARPFYIESLRLIEEGRSDFETLDELMESAGFRLGPFRLMDLIGNDVNFAVSNSVYEQLGRPERLKPSVLQEEKVKAGQLGRKSGEGYYKY